MGKAPHEEETADDEEGHTCASYDLYGFGCNPASLFRNIPLFPLSNCFDYGCKGNILYRYRHTG